MARLLNHFCQIVIYFFLYKKLAEIKGHGNVSVINYVSLIVIIECFLIKLINNDQNSISIVYLLIISLKQRRRWREKVWTDYGFKISVPNMERKKGVGI